MTTRTPTAAQRPGESRPTSPAPWHSGRPRTPGSESDACQEPRRDDHRASWNGSQDLVSTRTSSASVDDQALEATEYDQWFDRAWGKYSFGIELGSVLGAVGLLSHEMSVLDAGCGTGRFTAELEARGASVVGLDLDRQMLDIAVTRTEGHVVVGDAHRIPFADGAFDCVVAVTLCEFTGRPDEVFAELARVTRLGGLVVVGALNPRSSWGLRKRRQLRRPPWTGARFLAPSTLVAIGRQFGHVSISGSLYAPGPIVALRILGPLLERMGRMAPRFGAFQLLMIQRSEP